MEREQLGSSFGNLQGLLKFGTFDEGWDVDDINLGAIRFHIQLQIAYTVFNAEWVFLLRKVQSRPISQGF